VEGDNISDDLFMYLKRKITGLSAHTIYKLTFDIEVGTSVMSIVI